MRKKIVQNVLCVTDVSAAQVKTTINRGGQLGSKSTHSRQLSPLAPPLCGSWGILYTVLGTKLPVEFRFLLVRRHEVLIGGWTDS